MEKTAENHQINNTDQPSQKQEEALETKQTVETKQGKDQESSSEEEEVLTEEQKQMWARIDTWLKEFYLTPFQMVACKQFLKNKVANPNDKTVDRCRQWVFMRLNGRKVPDVYHPRQLGCPDLVPGLSLQGWWPREKFDWILKLEEKAPIIREELLELRKQSGFQPYRSPAYANKNNLAKDGVGSLGTDSGDWNVYYLYLHDIEFKDNCSRVPKTMQILEDLVPRNYMHCFFSALSPGTHITPHNGPTGKKLRVHLPLVGTQGARMRVGDETVQLEQDKCIIFDDSFNHEAWHDGDSTRVNLIIDIWHPELTKEELKFFIILQKAKLKGDRILAEKVDNDDHLYSIIEKTKDILKSNDDWWVN